MIAHEITARLFGECAEDQGKRSRDIERQIERRTCGRIRGLHVTCSGDTVILHGRCRTYHEKQLAQEAVLDLADGTGGLVNQIVVL